MQCVLKERPNDQALAVLVVLEELGQREGIAVTRLGGVEMRRIFQAAAAYLPVRGGQGAAGAVLGIQSWQRCPAGQAKGGGVTVAAAEQAALRQ